MADKDQNNEEYEFSDLDIMNNESKDAEAEGDYSDTYRSEGSNTVLRNALIAVGVVILALILYRFLGPRFGLDRTTDKDTRPSIADRQGETDTKEGAYIPGINGTQAQKSDASTQGKAAQVSGVPPVSKYDESKKSIEASGLPGIAQDADSKAQAEASGLPGVAPGSDSKASAEASGLPGIAQDSESTAQAEASGLPGVAQGTESTASAEASGLPGVETASPDTDESVAANVVQPVNQRLSILEITQQSLHKDVSSLTNQVNEINNTVSSYNNELSKLNQMVEQLSHQLEQQSQDLARLRVKKVVAKKKIHLEKKVIVPVLIYHIQAIIPGRAWLIATNGSTITVRVGSELAGYGAVTLIDPIQGKVLTKSGKIIRFSAMDS